MARQSIYTIWPRGMNSRVAPVKIWARYVSVGSSGFGENFIPHIQETSGLDDLVLSTVIRIRYRSDIGYDTVLRGGPDNREWSINAITNIGTRRYLDLSIAAVSKPSARVRVVGGGRPVVQGDATVFPDTPSDWTAPSYYTFNNNDIPIYAFQVQEVLSNISIYGADYQYQIIILRLFPGDHGIIPFPLRVTVPNGSVYDLSFGGKTASAMYVFMQQYIQSISTTSGSMTVAISGDWESFSSTAELYRVATIAHTTVSSSSALSAGLLGGLSYSRSLPAANRITGNLIVRIDTNVLRSLIRGPGVSTPIAGWFNVGDVSRAVAVRAGSNIQRVYYVLNTGGRTYFRLPVNFATKFKLTPVFHNRASKIEHINYRLGPETERAGGIPPRQGTTGEIGWLHTYLLAKLISGDAWTAAVNDIITVNSG